MKKQLSCLALSLVLLLACALSASAADNAGLVQDVIDDLSSHDDRCESAPQQLANGLYRAVELAGILALASGQSAGVLM